MKPKRPPSLAKEECLEHKVVLTWNGYLDYCVICYKNIKYKSVIDKMTNTLK